MESDTTAEQIIMPEEPPEIVTEENFVAGVINAPRNFRKIVLTTPGKDSVVPSFLDSRSRCLPPSWQGKIGQCLTAALAGRIEFLNWKWFGEYKQLDHHKIYIRAKEIDGDSRSGTTPASALQAAQELEILDPVDADSVRELGNMRDVMRALHMYDTVMECFAVTDKWFSAGKDGFIEPGGRLTGELHMVLGTGHAMRQERRAVDFANSWGQMWGNKGFGRLDYNEAVRTLEFGLIFGFDKSVDAGRV